MEAVLRNRNHVCKYSPAEVRAGNTVVLKGQLRCDPQESKGTSRNFSQGGCKAAGRETVHVQSCLDTSPGLFPCQGGSASSGVAQSSASPASCLLPPPPSPPPPRCSLVCSHLLSSLLPPPAGKGAASLPGQLHALHGKEEGEEGEQKGTAGPGPRCCCCCRFRPWEPAWRWEPTPAP